MSVCSGQRHKHSTVSRRLKSLSQPHKRLCVFVGKLGTEEENKEEFRMEREPPATHEEGTGLSVLSLPLPVSGAVRWDPHTPQSLSEQSSC